MSDKSINELHAAIMNIQDGVQPEGEKDAFCRGFKFGHRAARIEAAELVAAYGAASPSAPEAQGEPHWKGLSADERDLVVGELVEYGTDFVAPLYAVVENVERTLMERNSRLPAPSPSPVLVEEAMRQENEQLRKALEDLMELERRGRLMPIGREWDAARAALSSHGDKGGSK